MSLIKETADSLTTISPQSTDVNVRQEPRTTNTVDDLEHCKGVASVSCSLTNDPLQVYNHGYTNTTLGITRSPLNDVYLMYTTFRKDNSYSSGDLIMLTDVYYLTLRYFYTRTCTRIRTDRGGTMGVGPLGPRS